jgi:hypothetical protein
VKLNLRTRRGLRRARPARPGQPGPLRRQHALLRDRRRGRVPRAGVLQGAPAGAPDHDRAADRAGRVPADGERFRGQQSRDQDDAAGHERAGQSGSSSRRPAVTGPSRSRPDGRPSPPPTLSPPTYARPSTPLIAQTDLRTRMAQLRSHWHFRITHRYEIFRPTASGFALNADYTHHGVDLYAYLIAHRSL